MNNMLINQLHEEICEICEQRCQHKQPEHINHLTENAKGVIQGDSYLLARAKIALTEIVEINLKRIRKNCGNNYIRREENSRKPKVTLQLQIKEPLSKGDEEIKAHKVMKYERMSVKEIIECIEN